MDLKDFIERFEAQLEDITPGSITADTRFRELQEWDSMTALAIIAMVDHKYNKILTGDDIVGAETVGALFNTIAAK